MNSCIFLRPLMYLDPGTGSFIIQILLTGLLGIGVAVKIYWEKIISFFKGDKKEETTLDRLDEIDEYGDGLNTTKDDAL